MNGMFGYCLFPVPYPPLLPIHYSLLPPSPHYCLFTIPYPLFSLPLLLPSPFPLLPPSTIIAYSLLPTPYPLLPPPPLIAYSLSPIAPFHPYCLFPISYSPFIVEFHGSLV